MHCLNCGGTLNANRHCQPCITRKATTNPKKWVASLSGHLHCTDCGAGIPSGTVRCMLCRKKFAAASDPETHEVEVMTFIPRPEEIARGTAGDCCVLCGKVGINLPLEHGCKPNIDVDAYRAQPRLSWEAAWTRRDNQRVTPQIRPTAIPTTKALAGLVRTVANAQKGQRQTILFWAGSRAAENGYPESAFELLEATARSIGADNHDIETGLRMRPSRQRMHA